MEMFAELKATEIDCLDIKTVVNGSTDFIFNNVFLFVLLMFD